MPRLGAVLGLLLAAGCLCRCAPALPDDKVGLMRAMGSNDMGVNFSAARKFARLFGVPGLLEAVGNSDANTRAVAAHFLGLGDHGTPEVEAALIRTSQDADEYVRMWSAFSLGRIGSAQARRALEGLVKDPSQVVSRQAAEAIETLDERLGLAAGGRTDRRLSAAADE